MIARVLFLILALSARAEDLLMPDIKAMISDAAVLNVAPTGSMKPTFDENYFILVRSSQVAPFKSLKPGDIIVFYARWRTGDKNKTLFCHRVYSVSSGKTYVVTKGDANKETDDWYLIERDYVGKVIGVIRRDEG